MMPTTSAMPNTIMPILPGFRDIFFSKAGEAAVAMNYLSASQCSGRSVSAYLTLCYKLVAARKGLTIADVKRSGSADLPLHGGYVPAWLATRMTQLGTAIAESIILHYGHSELLSRLSDPFWF